MDLGVGDIVIITECRPLSKTKRFKVTEIVKAAPRVSEMIADSDVEGVKRTKEAPVAPASK